jgi:hypothetical protein
MSCSCKATRLITAAILGFILITGIVAAARAHKGSNDFDTFYAAGKAVLTHQGIYYQGEYYGTPGNKGPFLYSPAAACFFAAFAVFPIWLAAFLFNALNVFLYGWCLKKSGRLLDMPGGFSAESLKPWREGLYFAMLFLLLLDNLIMAQANILVFALCVLALGLYQDSKNFRAGFALSAAILLKATPALFLFYFLLKRQWKVLGGTLAGLAALTVLIPTLIFGPGQNRVYHRQWLGRIIKPTLVTLQAKREKDDGHPLKKSAEQIRFEALTAKLTEKNQSLEGGLTRLLLKDRNRYADEGSYPIQAATRYRKLPVLFGGIKLEKLSLLTTAVKGLMFLCLLALWTSQEKNPRALRGALEISLVFLSMPLLSPVARSHQFVVWAFPFLALMGAGRRAEPLAPAGISAAARAACVIYFLQMLPYGKAAGMGTWANVVLWAAFVFWTLRSSKTHFPKPESQEPHARLHS